MNLDRLQEILRETTIALRSGPVFSGSPALVAAAERGEPLTGGGVLEVNAYPPVEAAADGLEKIDMVLIVIGVDREAAARRKGEFVALLAGYPDRKELADGPSYIAVGAALGDQELAFRLFALGKNLRLWEIITPATFGATGAQAREMAGLGYVMITGFPGRERADG